MKSILLIIFLRGLSLLPLGAVRKIGALLGGISYAISSRMAETTKTNIAICYPELPLKERNVLVKCSISNTFQTLAEAGPAWLWPANRVLDHIIEVEGLELLEEAMARGKGTIVLGPHLGNWEVLGLYLNNCGCGQSYQMYQAPKDPRLSRMIYDARSRAGARLVETDSKGVGMLLKSLKNGEIAGILPDQVPPESGGKFAPFFNREALTMTLVARLLNKTGARCILGYAARTASAGRQGWKVVFRKPSEEIYAEHIQDSLVGMNQSIEALVNECPEQYQWEYKRFKRSPEGQSRPY